MIKLFKILSQMSSVKRYSHSKLLSPEDVMQHTGCVSVIACWILGKLRESDILDQIGWTEGEELALFRSIALHDMDEVSLGDIPRPTKYATADLRELIHKIETTSTRQIIKDFDLPSDWFDFWNESKCGRAGLILVASDIMSVIYKKWEERLMGNQLFDPKIQMIDSMLTEMECMSDNFLSKFALAESDREFILFIRSILDGAKGVMLVD